MKDGNPSSIGRVILVGAGPGDPDLITMKGAAALARADIVLFDELASVELLEIAPLEAEKINVGKRGHDPPTRSQAEINERMVAEAQAGKCVVRLKGGDPFVFGRGGEEASACEAAGIPFEIVPGVSSALAAPAYAGIPLTDRRHSASFAVVTGHKDLGDVSSATRWRELGSAVDTLVILMGMQNLRSLLSLLVEGGKDPATPAAVIMNGTTPEQRVQIATLSTLADIVEAERFGAPSAVVVGDVVGLRESLSWRERSPLFGLRALVTRPSRQAQGLASALRSEGAIPVIRPLIDLVPIEDAAALAEVESALGDIEGYDDLLFSSSNAVRFFSERARGTADFPSKLSARVLCIGAATARTAVEAGLSVHYTLAGGRGNAESMLAEIVNSLAPEGRRVLIPRSDRARDVLARGLREAGSHVDAVIFYRNLRPEVDRENLRAELLAGELPLLTFSSPSAVEHFSDLLDPPSREACQGCIIAAIGRTTARALDQSGLAPQVVAARPDVREMVRDLSDYVRQRKGRDPVFGGGEPPRPGEEEA